MTAVASRRSALRYSADPEAACDALRALFPDWDIEYRIGVLCVSYTAWREHDAGRAGVNAREPAALAWGMERFEEDTPWPT